MHILKRLTPSYRLIFLMKILGIILTFNISSCDCIKKGGNDADKNGSLLMEITPPTLENDQKEFEAVFILSDATQIARLENFKLKVSFSKEEGGTNSELKYVTYVDGKAISQEGKSIEESLNQFVEAQELKSGNKSVKIAFALIIPDPSVTKLEVKLELLDAAGSKVQEGTCSWKKTSEPTDLGLEIINLGDDVIKGNQPVQLQITNKGKQKIVAGSLKLNIVRIKGSHAVIQGAVASSDGRTFVLDLGEIEVGWEIAQNVIINPGADTKSIFTFQLMHQERFINSHSPIVIKRKKDIQLDLSGIKYDRTTKHVIYTIRNRGTESAGNVQLQYKSTGAELGGKSVMTVNLGMLAPNEKRKSQDLGELDFKGQPSANFKFKVMYDDRSYLSEPYTFTVADVDLRMKVKFRGAAGMFTYNVINDGKEEAKNVVLKYSNVSRGEDGQTVLLNGKTSDTIDLGALAADGGETGLGMLPIDFKYADTAIFKFELFYDGILIVHETATIKVKAKPVGLELVSNTPLLLTGANQEIKLKINPGAYSRPMPNVDLSRLELNVTNQSGNDAFISELTGGTGITSIGGKQIGESKGQINLLVNPKTTKEAVFIFELKYKGARLGDPVTVTWKEDKLVIQDLTSRFVGNNVASLKLWSRNKKGAIDTKNITIELTSNNNASFTWIGTQSYDKLVGSHVTLDKLVEDDSIADDGILPIQFKLQEDKGENDAMVTVTIKRDTTILDESQVVWKKQGINIDVEVQGLRNDRNVFEDEKVVKIGISTTEGDLDNINKIKIKLINDKGVEFTLLYNGNEVSGDKIDSTLQAIINQNKLKKDNPIFIQLKLTRDPGDVYGTDLTLELLDEKDKSLYKKDLIWINKTALDSLFVPLKDADDIFEKSKENAENAKNAKTWDKWLQAVKEAIATKITFQEFIAKIETISSSKKLPSLLNDFFQEGGETMDKLSKDIADRDAYALESIKWAKERVEFYAEKVKKDINEAKTSSKPTVVMHALQKDIETSPMDIWYKYTIDLANEINISDAKQLGEEVEAIMQETISTLIFMSQEIVELAKHYKTEATAIATAAIDVAAIDNEDGPFTIAGNILLFADLLKSIADLAKANDYEYKAIYTAVAQAGQYAAEAFCVIANVDATKFSGYNSVHVNDAPRVQAAAELAGQAAAEINPDTKANNEANKAAKAAYEAAKKTWALIPSDYPAEPTERVEINKVIQKLQQEIEKY